MPKDILHVRTDEERNEWASGSQFLLTCIGYAVGLGNIWRFPSLAYENGGGAFLIPYITCSLLIGFPLLYLEMSLGQFCKAGPALVYGWIRPAFQGIGWAMAMVSLLIGIYYNVIVAWTLIYLYTFLTGNAQRLSSCSNPFNTIYCSSLEELGTARQWNGTADAPLNFLLAKNATSFAPVSPAEEFFENYVLEKSQTMDGLGGINQKMVVALGLAWLFTVLVLCRGVEVMGKIAWFTGTTPYIIIAILLIRGVTLDGARLGLDYYLLRPDLSVLWKVETWRAAATQVCYSLAIGLGGLLSLSSFNHFHHNCFRDAFLIALADSSTAILGGTAVFATLGFMSKRLNIPISEVVQSGTGLVFIAYPEAISQMPLAWLWQFLFFLMVLILGIASHFGLAEVMCTALQDQFPALRRRKAWLVLAVCLCCYLCGLLMCTRAGIFYFNIFDEYTASFSMLLLVFLELILVCHIYGLVNYLLDLQAMMGPARTWLARIYGPSSICMQIVWHFIAPLLLALVFLFALVSQIATPRRSYGKLTRLYVFPGWAILFGWTLSVLPLLFLPALFIANLAKFRRMGKGWTELFKLQREWPSFERNAKAKGGTSPVMSVELSRSGLEVVQANE